MRNRLAGVLASALLCGLAYAGAAVADDQQPNPATPAPQPGAPPATQGRTLEPTVEKLPQPKPINVYERVKSEPLRISVDKTEVDGYLKTWPARSAAAARLTIASYGLPSEATATMLIWHESGPWARTVVYREGVRHDFPSPHSDVIEQTARLRVPLGKVNDLIAFDGSLIVKRTEGVVASRCESEAMNFVAINLAHDIAVGKKTTAQARAAFAKAAVTLASAEPHEYSQDLRFDESEDPTNDPDKAVIKQAPAGVPTSPGNLPPQLRPKKNGPNPSPSRAPEPTPTPDTKPAPNPNPNAPPKTTPTPTPTSAPSESRFRSNQ